MGREGREGEGKHINLVLARLCNFGYILCASTTTGPGEEIDDLIPIFENLPDGFRYWMLLFLIVRWKSPHFVVFPFLPLPPSGN